MEVERKANRVKTTKLVKTMIDREYAKVNEAREQGKLVAWLVGPPPYDMLRAMDITYVHMENYAAMCTARKGERELRQASEGAGYPIDMCSYARITNGAAILSESGHSDRIRPDLLIPRPDFLYVSPCCQTMGYWYESLLKLLNVPGFYLDIPESYHDSELRKNVAYVRDQLEDFARFLENITGRRFDWDRLSYYIGLVKEGTVLKRQCFDLCKHIPSPMSQFDWSISLAPTNNLRGTPEAVDYFRALRAELEDRVANSISSVPHEHYRLYWDHIHVWFKLRELSEWFAAHNACVVASNYTQDGFFYYPEDIDPAKPLETIALEQCRVFMLRGLDYHINLVAKFVEEYKLDGLIMHSSRTCRSMELGQYDVVDAIEKRFGIPGVVIEGDHADPALYSDSQWEETLETFLETVEARKAARR